MFVLLSFVFFSCKRGVGVVHMFGLNKKRWYLMIWRLLYW